MSIPRHLRQGSWWYTDGEIAVPTIKKYATAKLLKFDAEKIYLHWTDNYNLAGDFRTELMKFEATLSLGSTIFVLDAGDKAERNALRRKHNLIPIK